jgi:rare lipoprotein A
MIISTKQLFSSVWLVIALIVVTLLAFALPGTSEAQSLASEYLTRSGRANWYNIGQHGVKTASGERYDHKAFTAAHATLPFNSMVKVTNLENDIFVVVRINDRPKPGSKFEIDLSGAAAQKLGLFEHGPASIRISEMESSAISLVSTETDYSLVRDQRDDAVTPIRTVSASVPSNRNGAYTLQIGSFSTEDRAKALANQYPEAWTARVEVNGETTYRVYYSRFEQEKPARVAQNDLWVKGQDSFLRKVAS